MLPVVEKLHISPKSKLLHTSGEISTSVVLRNYKLLHMWINFIFLHNHHVWKLKLFHMAIFYPKIYICGICDKYEVCPCHVNDNDKYKTLMKLKEKTLKMHYFHVVHRHAAHITGLAGAASEIPILLHTIWFPTHTVHKKYFQSWKFTPFWNRRFLQVGFPKSNLRLKN